jgi:hypothetical protein
VALAARVGLAVWAALAARVDPAVWVALAARVDPAVWVALAPTGRRNGRAVADSAPLARRVAAGLAIWAADARPGSSTSAARKAGRIVSSDRQVEVLGAAVGVLGAADAAAEGVRRSGMGMCKYWPCSILVAHLWLAAAYAAPVAAPEPQRSFASAEDAVTAFVTALRDDNGVDLRAVLGPEGDHVIDSGDQYADRELHQRFVALYDQKHTIEQNTPGHAVLDVGPDDWPMPIPLVETEGRWTFDTKLGAQTIVDRRIGRNELSAIRTLLACVDAQHDYFERARQATGTGVYATRLFSTPGRQDGLFWPVAEGQPESPLGPLIEAAQDAGYPGELIGGKAIPYEGYNFRLLKAQGPNGDGGAKNYIQSGRMTGGFALVAWPAVYGSSGITTFIVGPDGDVYQKDLGPETARIAASMTTFDPDLSWSRVDLTND